MCFIYIYIYIYIYRERERERERERAIFNGLCIMDHDIIEIVMLIQ